MKRISVLIVILLACMSFAPTIAQIPAPNDTTTLNNVQTTLSIDGYVTSKFASVGSDVEIIALTRGHTSSTLVTADIIKYPEIDPIDLMTSTSLPGSGVVIDTVVMTQTGAHDNDSNTMVWEAKYTIPSNSPGGVFGARVIAEDGNLVATDDPTQLSRVLRSEFEKVLQAIDDAWDTANPCLEVKGEFDSLQNIISSNGNWSTFVAVATEGQGVGGSEQLWDAMIDAGHNQYDMSAGANFLTALMEFFDSDDIDASMSFITGLLLYAGEFPLPRTFDDFDDVVEYAKTFDAIENYTRFEGTGDFEAAYNALVGSNEWVALRQAMDDLANSTKVLEATQTITHNIALLAVSGHPDAIIDALEVWATPLLEGDISNMTPVQVLIVRWIEMADYLEETDVIDTDGDEVPDQLIWQYEKLLETSEGQAWTANMESTSSSSYVNDAFDNFNTLPEDVINDIFDSMQDPIWNATGEVLQEFVEWMSNASFGDRNIEWETSEEEEEESSVPDSVIFEELYDVSTTLYGGHILDIGIELRYWGPYNDTDYPSQYSMSMTNNHGVTKNTVLEQKSNDRSTYLGRLTADNIEEAIWTFTQPLENYNGDMSTMEGAHLKMESLRPSMLEMMSYEGADETFIVSALGVVVEQDETTLVSAPYLVSAIAYNATGPVENAEVDAAIVRVSPQLAEETIAQFSPDGDVEITSSEGGIGTNSEFSGNYTGNDLAGDVRVLISPYSGHDDDREYPQASSLENDIEVAGSGSSWDAGNQISGLSGLVDVTTSGTTVNGLEFDIMMQVTLPGTSGCARTEGNAHSGNHVDIGWSYGNFRNDEGELDKPELSNVEVDWGDGNTTERQMGSQEQDAWWSHDYSTEDAEDEYTIVITFSDVDGREVIHSQNVTEDQAFWHVDDEEDGGGWFEEHFEKGECELIRTQSVMPTALIIDGFFTDGPIEVMDEQILTTNQNGEVSMTSTPTFPGIYLSIVESKIMGADGITYTGLGMNFGVVTEASLSLGGLTEETTLAGIPVYSVQPDPGGLTSISVTPSGVSESNYNVSLMVMPMDLSVPFPNIEDAWGEEEKHTLEFQQGDTTRSQEVRIKAPISMMVAMILEEDALLPTAIHVGLILNNPSDLNMTGTLGPGQIGNIALRNETASRILAMAAPRSGFDPATLDLSSLSELFYTEGVRQEIGWIPVEQDLEKICEKFGGWSEERWENNTYSNVRMSLRQKMKVDYVPKQSPWPSYDPTNAVLTNSEDESLVTPISDWTLETDGRYYANYDLEAGKTYLLNSTTDYGGMFEFELSYEEGWPEIEYHNDDQTCLGDNEEMSEDEVFDLFDEFFSDFNSVAWGQGSSADLRLPILSSPSDDYTVIAVAQVGEGANTALVSAWGSEISVPNPEPPQMENLTLSFSPANPMPDDIVQVTATDESNQPVDGLSFTVVRNNQTLVALVSNDYGQVEFAIPEGTIIVRASGGNYYPAELTIVVSDSGSTVDNGSLPSDADGDGVDDSVDACPNTPIGTTVDAVGCAIVTPPSDTDGDGVYDDVDTCPNTPTGTMVDAVGCAIDDGTTDNNGTNGTNGTDGTDGTNGTDNTDETDGTDNTGTAGSGDEKLSTTALAMIILTGFILAAIGVATMVLIKRRKGGDDWGDDGDVMFDSPDRPSPNTRGEIRDGYEVIEYPKGTGAWWYRDNETGHWMEWT